MSDAMRDFDTAEDTANNKRDQWETIRNGLSEIRTLIKQSIGEGAVVDTNRKQYSSAIEISIEAHVEDPREEAVGLMERYNWDDASLKQRHGKYRLYLNKRLNGH